jgi:hypothetical protein
MGAARATAQIGEEGLREYPPIVLVFGPCCEGTQAGDLYVVRADGTGLRRLKHWGPFGVEDGKAYGAYHALWSHDRGSIALALGATRYADPDTAVHLISMDGRNLRRLSEWCRLLEAWSHDGKKLFHSNWGCTGYEKLRSVRPPAASPRLFGSLRLGIPGSRSLTGRETGGSRQFSAVPILTSSPTAS